MKTEVTKQGETSQIITITVGDEDLKPIKRQVYNRLRPEVKAPGFRPGKAPDNIIERELGLARVQQEVAEAAINQLYFKAIKDKQLEPLALPQVELKKFVPYSQLEFQATVEVMPAVKLADYKKLSHKKDDVAVSKEEIDKVIETIRERLAKKESVQRAAKSGDEIVIDFKGSRDGKPIPNAASNNYPLRLGSGQFIPGFEDELIGLKPGASKQFQLKFPKDYAEKSLAGKTVDFEVKVHTVNELTRPKIDEELAKQAGPFQNLKELRESIQASLESEKAKQAQAELENAVVKEVVEKSKLALPEGVVQRQQQALVAQLQRDLEYRDETLESYLKSQGKSRDDLDKELKPEAERRVKTGLVLTKIAETEKLEVSAEELEVRLQILKGQHRDSKVQEELDKPEARREIANQLLTEKVIEKLIAYAAKDGSQKGTAKK